MTGQNQKKSPIPTRFEDGEDQYLKRISNVTGLSVSEIIRRSVRLMKRQTEITQSHSFILELVR